MPISESILTNWAAHVPSQDSEDTHLAVRRALSNHAWPHRMTYELYLQGSYRNTTNVRNDSDIDLVAELTSSVYNDLRRLDSGAQLRVKSRYSSAEHTITDFRRAILKALIASFGDSSVKDGNKAIRLEPRPGPLPADVVACTTYRLYLNEGQYEDGIKFWTQDDGREIVNFPKQHYANGVKKQAETQNRFKPTIRMIKNARSFLVDNELLNKDTAPSYCVECLLYNVPATCFHYKHTDTYAAVVNWLAETELDEFVCQSELQYLFKGSSADWNVTSAQQFVRALITLSNA